MGYELINKHREEADSVISIKVYLISNGPIDSSEITYKAYDYMAELNNKWRKERDEEEQQRERKMYEHLKKKFEGA